jgi:hypothetical protein
MRFDSRRYASDTVSVTVYWTSATSVTIRAMRASSGPRAAKYERTRLRSESALPTYSTRPSAFFIR